MGASVGQAYGAGKALGKEGLGKICAVIGDSTFLHGGIAPVMDTVYNKGYATSIILDNRTTGMTGLQEHAGTGYTLAGEPANMVDYEKLVRALGVKRVRKVDPYNLKAAMKTIKEEMETDEASVIITKNGPCMLHRREKRKFPLSLLHDRRRDVPGLQGLSGTGLSRHQLGRGRWHDKRRQEEKRDSLYQQDPVPRLRPLRAGL